MAARPTWEGHLRLSLVTCPVRLFKAVGEGDQVHFNLLHRETLNRVRQAWKDPDDGLVERKDLVRGYQVERDRYVVVEDEELKKLKLESTKVIDIERFVDGREIDRLYWDEPYYLVPDGKPAQDAYAVIREAMRGEHQVALGRLVMSSRERIVAVEARGKGMLLSTLHSHDEVRSEDDAFETIAEVKIDKRMVEIAQQIIAQAKGPFDPAEFHDRYKEAVRELVESKAEGERVVHRPTQEPAESNVIDLMEALRRSLKAPQGPVASDKKEERRAAPARGAAKKGSTAKGGGSGERRAPPRKGGSHAPRRAAG
ncbi:non-homologous end joining protein Ku [Falsiroseomonas oryzae]|uniref:non-homologous end joining protein Ku n=1 Tax=Falsiroseomonas oryzae TaxID=2766473 RepID=UPI0022EB4A70|nr:Ku protein [Roseomonas sp. MO-31]